MEHGCPECGRKIIPTEIDDEKAAVSLAEIEAEIEQNEQSARSDAEREHRIDRQLESWEARGKRVDAFLDRLERLIERSERGI